MDDGDLVVELEQRQFEQFEKQRNQAASRHLLETGSATECIECDKPIPEPRRKAVKGVQLCIECQAAKE